MRLNRLESDFSILPLRHMHGHMFVEIDNEMWLVDTGAPTSFGDYNCIAIGSEQFYLDECYHSYTAEMKFSTIAQSVTTRAAAL